MRGLIIVFFIALLGCDSPGPGFSGSPVTRVSHGGYEFSLRRSGSFVQIIRTNFLRRPDINLIGSSAEHVVEAHFGCPAVKMRGDVAMMVAQIDCSRAVVPGQSAKWVAPRRSVSSCVGQIFGSTGGSRADFEVTCF